MLGLDSEILADCNKIDQKINDMISVISGHK